ncbi:hypothetical protein SBDP1_80044 [Syntrophobacter sp. SbD1]|nr:hypothetical protein SBDP1_80044 [Syntrophobacter sp. SbD1]
MRIQAAPLKFPGGGACGDVFWMRIKNAKELARTYKTEALGDRDNRAEHLRKIRMRAT